MNIFFIPCGCLDNPFYLHIHEYTKKYKGYEREKRTARQTDRQTGMVGKSLNTRRDGVMYS